VDVLSDVLRAVHLTGAVFFDVEACSPWVATTPNVERFKQAVMPAAEHVIAFHVLLEGSCWAELVDGSESPTRLNAGDLIVIPMGDEHVFASEPGMRTVPDLANYRRPTDRRLPVPFVLNEGGGPDRCHFVCGYFGCDVRPFNPLLGALPRTFHAPVSAASQRWLLSLLGPGVEESERGTAGGEAMLTKLAELMFVEIIRKCIAALPDDARGWFSALRDRHIGAALHLIHGRPAEDWTVDRLAREIGLSRSAFAERFVNMVGVPPMHYLSRWRLQLAANLLVYKGVGIAAAAAEVGYASEAAFNRAFKKLVGIPPGAWRKSRGDRASVGSSPAAPDPLLRSRVQPVELA
jgi:AraC-like DNA-binding protein